MSLVGKIISGHLLSANTDSTDVPIVKKKENERCLTNYHYCFDKYVLNFHSVSYLFFLVVSGDLKPVQGSVETYLGRPWQKYSRTVVMKSNIDALVSPAGWAPWAGSFALSTLYYGEYMNVGAGASTGGRVKWAGFHAITNPAEAGKFSVGNFLAGDSWIPGSGVPFDAGL